MTNWQTFPVVDDSIVARLLELGGPEDPGLFRELVELYLADAPRLLSALEGCLAAGDGSGLERAAHTLKSSSANMGAMRLSSLCKELESRARKQNLSDVPSLVAEARGMFNEVESALKDKSGAA